MNELINFFLLQTVAMIVVTLLIPGLKLNGLLGAFWMVAALALLNSTLWDSGLFHALPDVKSLHGLVLMLANGVLFWILVKILPGIQIKGVLPALLAPVTNTILTVLIQTYGSHIDVISTVKSFAQQVSGVRDTLKESEAIPQ